VYVSLQSHPHFGRPSAPHPQAQSEKNSYQDVCAEQLPPLQLALHPSNAAPRPLAALADCDASTSAPPAKHAAIAAAFTQRAIMLALARWE